MLKNVLKAIEREKIGNSISVKQTQKCYEQFMREKSIFVVGRIFLAYCKLFHFVGQSHNGRR